MAKRGGRKRNESLKSKTRQRVVSTNTRPYLQTHLLSKFDITNDRRRFDFHQDWPKDIYGRFVEFHRKKQKQNKKLIDRYAFRNPFKVSICRRRKSRRNILFALKKIGRGKGVSPIRKRNIYSNIICR